jgi:LL-diaminopimelate aminotransferase
MKFSQRVEALPPYLFVEISEKVAQKVAQGEKVISFAIGDPDLPTPPHIIERLCQAAHQPANHRYPETMGMAELRQTIAQWYQNRFGVAFDPANEVLPLIGAKEGIAHIAFCFIDPGDIALIPDPGYPVYSISTILAGGAPYFIPLLEENNFLPDLEQIPPEVAQKAKFLWINYPNNPTAAVAELDFFGKVVDFTQKYHLVVCHDAAYTEVAFDGYQPSSFMQVPGAKEVGVEFHSFSKSYNMTGWRIGMVVGDSEIINTLKRLKSNLDSGIPQAIQYAAIEAIKGSQSCIEEHNAVYQRRRDQLIEVLNEIGLKAHPPKASLFIWAKIPLGYTSRDFATKLLDEVGVVVIPGNGYGKYGEGYIRLSLTLPDDELDEGLKRLKKLKF